MLFLVFPLIGFIKTFRASNSVLEKQKTICVAISPRFDPLGLKMTVLQGALLMYQSQILTTTTSVQVTTVIQQDGQQTLHC